METNAASIYGTSASPFKRLSWGRCTQKPGVLYLHVFDWPSNGKLVVPALANDVKKAYFLADKSPPLEISRMAEDVVIRVPATAPDAINTVVVLEIEGDPIVSQADVRQAADLSINLVARDAETFGANLKYESGSGKDNIGYWTNPDDYVSWVCRVNSAGKFTVHVTYACPDPAGSRYTVDVGGTKLAGVTESTGSWTHFETKSLGTVALSADRHILTVKAQSLRGEGVMNLKSIVLRPVQ